MPKSEPERLAAALRENLKKRKGQARAAPQPSFGADEEGDVAPPQDGVERPGAWVEPKN